MFLLIKAALDNRIPDEKRVSNLFQTTRSESRGLIKSVMSKYQYDLKTSIDETLKDIVRNVEKQNNELIAVIYNESVKDELNKILSLRRKGACFKSKRTPARLRTT